MPPLILIVGGLLGGAVLVRFVVREARRVNRELDQARETKLDDGKNIPSLRRDPESGAFRPE